MADDLTPQQKLDLIKENLSEIMHLDIVEDIVLKQKRPMTIYWGVFALVTSDSLLNSLQEDDLQTSSQG